MNNSDNNKKVYNMKKFIYSMFALAMMAMTFASCEDVPMPYDQPGEGGEEPVIVQPTGDGTLENPFNVAAALEYTNSLAADEESPKDIYIKGKVVTVTEEYSTSFGNGTYYISDDGTNKNQFYVYRAMYLGNKSFKNGDTQIQEGDEVIICGRVINFKGTTPETQQKKAFLYSLNGVTAGGGGGGGDQTAIEVTCAKAVELTNALDDGATSSEVYAVTGYITEVVGSPSKNQQTFWMADTKDGGRVFEAYWANLPEGVSEFKAGSKVKITGNLTKYVNNGKVTAEIKNANVEILEQGGGGDTPSGTEINCAKAVELTNALDDNTTSTETYTVSGYITEVVGNVSKNQQTFWMADTKDGGRVFEAYWANLPEGVSEFKVGTKVKITGKLQKYVNNGNVTPEIKNADVEIVDGGGGGGETTGNVTKTVDGNIVTLVVADTAEGDKITVDLSAQGWESGKAVDPATITLSDGTKITFAKGEGSNTPAFYEATKGVRVYAKNTITISGKAVAKVVMTCDSYNGTAYTGNSTLYASANGTTFTICNEHSEAKGGDQLRVQAIEITYAQ